MYPETKGVPLEEMDAVFGEGNVLSYLCTFTCIVLKMASIEPEKGDSGSPFDRSTFRPSSEQETGLYPPRPVQTRSAGPASGWLGRLFQDNAPTSYHPISNEELAPLHPQQADQDRESIERDVERHN